MRVYSFGAKAPKRGQELLVQQLHLAHDYYNELIAIERQRREAYSACCSQATPELQEITLMIEACVATKIDARQEAAQERVLQRSRRASKPEIVEVIDAADDALMDLWERRKALVAQERRQNPKLGKEIDAFDKAAYQESKRQRGIYSAKGLYWGTYLTVEASVEQARKSHLPPKFRKGGGVTGQIAVQLQRGLRVEDMHNDTRMQIDPLGLGIRRKNPQTDHRLVWDATRGQRRRGTHTLARLRVGSAGVKPVWVEFPISLHRPIPPGSRLKWARLLVSRVADHFDYTLQLTVDDPLPEPAPIDPKTAVGIDLGWRWQDKVRVAYFYDGEGNHGSVSLPNDVVATLDHVRSLQSIRDRNFEEIKSAFSVWLSATTVPEWLTEETRGLSLWRNQGRLAGLLVGWWKDRQPQAGWKDRRFDGDKEMYEKLEAWRRQDRHLWTWAANERKKTLIRREETYRCWAAEMARKYSLIVVEDFDLRDLARKKPVEEDGEYDDLARTQRIEGAPSLLRSSLENACSSRGKAFLKRPCAGTTITCHECGRETLWDKAAYLTHRCECGATWDQDFNAAVNLYRDGVLNAPTLAERVAEQEKASAATREGRWKRRKAKKADATKHLTPAQGRAA